MLTRTKPQKELGTRRCMKKKKHQRKHSELKKPHEKLDKTKTRTARQKKTKKSPKMKNSNWKGALQKPL